MNCRKCQEPIHEKANKCHHCGSLVGLFGKIETSGLIIGLLLSVGSLITLAYPVIKESIRGKYAIIEGSIVKSNADEISFALANSGNSPAVITRIAIQSFFDNIPEESKNIEIAENLKILEHQKVVVLRSEKGSYGSQVAETKDIYTGKSELDISTTDCKVTIEYVVPGKEPQKAHIDFQCYAACFPSTETIKMIMGYIDAPM